MGIQEEEREEGDEEKSRVGAEWEISRMRRESWGEMRWSRKVEGEKEWSIMRKENDRKGKEMEKEKVKEGRVRMEE